MFLQGHTDIWHGEQKPLLIQQLFREASVLLYFYLFIYFQYKLEEVDITLPENKEWYKKYRYDIPVFHFEGKFLMKHRANFKLCEQTLTEYEEKTKKD